MNVLEAFQKITTFVFDVDGVLTDSTVLLLENGLQARTMTVKDGLALQMAQQNGYRVWIVSGGNSGPVADRMNYLGVGETHLGVKDKLAKVESLMETHGVAWQELLFMGDDLPDLSVLEKAGLACCPQDAVAEVKSVAAYVSPLRGGAGAVRDVIEKVLKLNNRWLHQPDIASR